MAKGPTRQMKNSMFFLMMGMLIVGFGVVIIRLFLLQMVDNEKYQDMAINQQLRDTTISPQRGTIYDTNMKVLAQSATVWTVYLSPRNVKDEQVDELATGLSKILGVDKDEIIEKTKKNNYYEIVKRKVEKPQRDEIYKFVTEKKIDGVHVAEDSKRYYPYGDFAASILGFTGTDNQGLNGIESQYDSYLTGTPGRIQTAANALGKEMPFEYEMLYEAKPGDDVVLTIDETLQHYLEKNLSNAVKEHKVAEKGAGIIMNVKTGEILAMSTKPDYDPNNPFDIYDSTAKDRLKGLKGDKYKEQLQEEQNNQWRNKVVSDLYEPGSVFKVVTCSAGLEEGKFTLKSPFSCSGAAKVSGTTMRCHLAGGHGAQTFSEALKNSCNPFLIHIGQTLGKEKFYEYYQSFGLTEKTKIDLPGEAQSLYYTDKQMGPVELASTSFGQSGKITPIQMVTAVATSVNGGNLIQPHIVKKVVDQNGNTVYSGNTNTKRQVISKETSNKIIEMLELVVTDSPSSKSAGVKGYRVGGKSGTSQKLDSKDKSARIASFAAFAPAEDPEIVVLIVLDEPHSYSEYGSILSAPVCGNILADALPYLGIMPNYTEEELKTLDISVPNVVGQTVSSAQNTLRDKGFKTKVIGSGTKVVGQFPSTGQKISSGSTVILYTEKNKTQEKVTVPDVKGMSPSAANRTLANAGLNIQIVGKFSSSDSPYAARQSVKAGSKVALGTVVKVEFTIAKGAGD